jgi:hypothetical protein
MSCNFYGAAGVVAGAVFVEVGFFTVLFLAGAAFDFVEVFFFVPALVFVLAFVLVFVFEAAFRVFTVFFAAGAAFLTVAFFLPTMGAGFRASVVVFFTSAGFAAFSAVVFFAASGFFAALGFFFFAGAFTSVMTEETELLPEVTVIYMDVAMKMTAQAMVIFMRNDAGPALPKRVWLPAPPNAAPMLAPFPL